MNSNRFRAALGAAAVIATLLASGVGVSPALAATTGDHAPQAGQGSDKDKSKGRDKDQDRGGKNDARKLAKAVDKVDDAFARLLSRTDKLSEESAARVSATITADRAALAQLTSVQDVRALQPENYEQVVAWLRKTEKLVAKVAADPAITEAATAVAEQLFAVTAASDKADLRTAKQLLNALKALVEDAEDDAEDEAEDETEVEVEDETGTDPGTDPGTEGGGDVLA